MPDRLAPGESTPIYICVDIEASGPIPSPYNMVSLGAVPVRWQAMTPPTTWAVDAEHPFYMELKPLYTGFDPEAMAIHGLSRTHLEANGLEPLQAMRRFSSWATSQGGPPVFVGHNAVFDWAFINHYYVVLGLENPFGWKGLDTKSLAAGVLGIPFLSTSKENLASLLPGIGGEDLVRKHRADYDALYQAQILAALLNQQRGHA